jgi:Ca2+-binding RTX toxin-like protein
MAITIGFKSIVLNAYAVLAGEKPGSAALAEHQAYIMTQGVGVAGYKAALEAFFGSTSTAVMAKSLLDNLGLGTAFTQAQAEAFLTANTGNRVGAMMDLASQLYSYNGADAAILTAKASYVAKITASDVYSSNATNVYGESINTNVGQTISLTTGFDSLMGTALGDSFLARTIGNENTLNDADVIDGGEGADTLFVDFASINTAITPRLTNVETVVIRAQNVPSDSTNDNNMAANTVQVDAQRSLAVDNYDHVTAANGVTRWESNNSRSDVIIEDVRIGNSQKTSAVTIAMVETDPGDVDFGVYFDQLSLRNSSSSTSTIELQLMDTNSAASDATKPLESSPYDRFQIKIGTTDVIIQSKDIDDAKTYDALITAVNTGITAKKAESAEMAALLKGLVASKGSDFTITDPLTGKAVTGTGVLLTDSNGNTLAKVPSAGWATPTGVVPSDSNIYTLITSGAQSTVKELVTSKIILDDVGRGSTGGDLVVGGMSVGATSTSRGVERFEIQVLDNSKLQTINGTNNALREVVITNGDTSNVVPDAYSSTSAKASNKLGNLTVNGKVGNDSTLVGVNSGNTTLNPYTANHDSSYGFTDVRLIDGSAMTGNLAFKAHITTDSIAKYITRVDTAANPAADVTNPTSSGNANFNVKGANFEYKGGSGHDTLNVTIDSGAVGSRSNVVSGQSDFTFNVSGGAGVDQIVVTVDTPTDSQINGNYQHWGNNQDLNNNITIEGGDGGDIIWKYGAGDTTIKAGEGNDTIYTDNSGYQVQSVTGNAGAAGADKGTLANLLPNNSANLGRATWVLNTVDQSNVAYNADGVVVNPMAVDMRNINDLRSDTNETYKLYKSNLVVQFKGIPSATITIAGSGYLTTDFEINQAIKEAINKPGTTLSTMLVARDGPAGSLIIDSLIDGVMSTSDISITLTAPTTLTAAELAGAANAYGVTSAEVLTTMAASIATFNTNGDYVDQMATDGSRDLVGAKSGNTSDNFVTPGTGNDVVVLGTAVTLDYGRSSNDVVIYEAGFGNDVIVNFGKAGTWGIDHLDLTALGGSAYVAGALSNSSGGIFVASDAAATKATVDAAAKGFTGTQVYIAYDAHNVGQVFSISAGVSTLQGTIDLADTPWGDLGAANFAVPTAISEGSSSIVPLYIAASAQGTTITGGSSSDTLNNMGYINTTMTGGADADTFEVSTVNYTGNDASAIITDLATGDVVTGAGKVIANNVTAFVATSATTANQLTINSAAAGSTVDMALAASTAVAIVGGAGVDVLTGSSGNDNLTGGAGNDTFYVKGGADTIKDLATGDVLVATGGTTNATSRGFVATSATSNTETVSTTGVATVVPTVTITADALVANANAPTGVTFDLSLAGGNNGFALVGGANVDTLTGSKNNDRLTGNEGNDTFNVTAGTDTVVDLTTGDILNVSAGATALVSLGFGGFTATAATVNAGTTTFTTAGKGLDLSKATSTVGYTINVTGGETVVASGAADTINLLGTGSTVTGGAGADTITVTGTGSNTLVYAASADLFTTQALVDSITGGSGTETIKVGTSGTAFAIAADDVWSRATNVDAITAAANTAAVTIALDVTAETAGIRTVDLSAATAAVGNAINVAEFTTAGVTMTGSTGADTLTGGAGGDTFVYGATGLFNQNNLVDTIVGGAGTDKVQFSAMTIAATDDWARASAVETLVGTNSGAYSLTLAASAATAGITTVDLSASASNDTINVSRFSTATTLKAGDGANTVVGGSGADTITTGSGNDTITGGAGADVIIGGNGTNTYNNLTATDLFLDTITGGTGTDTINLGTTVVADLAAITIAAADSWSKVTSVETITALANTAALSVTLGASAEAAGIRTVNLSAGTSATGNVIDVSAYTSLSGTTLWGAAGANAITGSAGADTIIGGGVVDTITGGLGSDSLWSNGGNDTFAFGTNGSVVGSAMDSIGDFGAAGDILTFGATTVLAAADATALAAGTNVNNTAGGLVSFFATDNTLALKIAAVQADAQLDAINTVAMFADGGNMYVYYAGAAVGNADDQIVQLTGQAALTTITAGATTTIA